MVATVGGMSRVCDLHEATRRWRAVRHLRGSGQRQAKERPADRRVREIMSPDERPCVPPAEPSKAPILAGLRLVTIRSELLDGAKDPRLHESEATMHLPGPALGLPGWLHLHR